MQTSNRQTTSRNQHPGSTNPFARALAEVENSPGSQQPWANLPENLDVNFGQASGGSFKPDLSKQLTPDQLAKKQQEELLKQRKRRELHDRINPVEAKDVFNARKEQVKKEIERLRQELKLLAQEVKSFHKEVEVTLMSNVADPGDGAYYLNFFQKLRAFIMLLRQKIKSAHTWATQVNNKKRKKKRGKRPGLEIAGAKHEKTSTVFDMMHHERSNSMGA